MAEQAFEIFGLTFSFGVDNKASPEIRRMKDELLSFARFTKESGKSFEQFSSMVQNHMRGIFGNVSDYERKFVKAYGGVADKLKNFFNDKGAGGPPGGPGNKDPQNLYGTLRTLSLGFVKLRAAMFAGQFMRRFADQCTTLNFKLSTMALTAGLSVEKLSQLGNSFRAYGGNASEAARGEHSYELEMERRRRGQGIGGVYAEAMKRYGIVFDPNERREDWFKRVIRWSESLGTGRAAEAARINLKQTAGLTDTEFRIMKKGMGAWEEELSRSRKYAPASAAAAEASEALVTATGHLTASWENLKNTVYVELAPLMETIYGWIEAVVDWFSELDPWFKKLVAWGMVIGSGIGIIGAATEAVSLLYRAIKSLSLVKGIASLFGAGSKVAEAGATAAQTAASVGGTGAAAGGLFSGLSKSLGGLSKMMGAVGIGTSAISAIGDAGIGFVLYRICSQVLEPWFAMWQVYALRGVVGEKQIRGVIDTAFAGKVGEDYKTRWLAAESYFRTQRNNEFEFQHEIYKSFKHNEGQLTGTNVSVDKIEISIDGAGNDAKDIAAAVHEKIVEEFQILAVRDNTQEIR